MRKATEVDIGFPYTCGTNCYIEVLSDGSVKQVPHKNKCDVDVLLAAVGRVRQSGSKLYCTWGGSYRTDLFEIDDIAALVDAFIKK